jgi:hypothetical protein
MRHIWEDLNCPIMMHLRKGPRILSRRVQRLIFPCYVKCHCTSYYCVVTVAYNVCFYLQKHSNGWYYCLSRMKFCVMCYVSICLMTLTAMGNSDLLKMAKLNGWKMAVMRLPHTFCHTVKNVLLSPCILRGMEMGKEVQCNYSLF